MRGTYITAGLIALLIGLWLFSGQLGTEDEAKPASLAEANRQQAAQAQDAAPTRVRARVVRAEPQRRALVVRGRTHNKRTVEVKAETAGRVVERPVEAGTRVDEGDLLCRISIDDREAGVAEARAALEQARIEYQASLRLKERGFQSETAIAQARARQAAAEAQVQRRELDLARTEIRAPFPGVVEAVQVERGDYLTPGAPCVTLVDMNPMLLVGRVSEKNVGDVETGQMVTGILSDGRRVQGPVTFVGQQSDPATRTYPLEVELDNADHALRSGLTTEIHIPVETLMAHKITPALFALSDDGSIGVRTINDRNAVEFHEIEVVSDAPDGVWVTGLPDVSTLITVGQELVVAGEVVEPVFEPAAEMPARAPDRQDDADEAPAAAASAAAPVRAIAAQP